MPDVKAKSFEDIRGMTITDDKKHAILSGTSNGTPLNLAIPVAELQNVLILALQAMGPLDQEQRRDGGPKRVLPVETWFFGLSPDGQHLVLSFRIQGGSELSFVVHPSVAGHMQEVLSS